MRPPHPPRPPARSRRGSRRDGGFTLLEIVVAFMIFFLIVSFAYWAMANSTDQSNAGQRMRQLRFLAERKLGEIALFERNYDDNFLPERFDDLPDDLREEYEGWEWSLEVRDVTVFGVRKDDNAPYLFPENDPGTDKDAAAPPATGAQKKGETQVLRELVLRVTSPSDEEGDGDSIEVVTYLPQVAAKAAPAGTAPK